tara:strand:- start:111 stop:923 length:813 start_codon:yes stop_codon:yes gene_type:complete
MNTKQKTQIKEAAAILQQSLLRTKEAGVNTDMVSLSWTNKNLGIYVHYSTALGWSEFAFENQMVNKPGFVKKYLKGGFYMDCDSPFEKEARKILPDDNVKVDAKATVLNRLEDNGYVTFVINNASTDLEEDELKALMNLEALRLSFELKKKSLLDIDCAIRVHDTESLEKNHKEDLNKNKINTKLISSVSKINDMPSIIVSGLEVTGSMLFLVRSRIDNWSKAKCDNKGLTINVKAHVRQKICNLGFGSLDEFTVFLADNHVLHVIPQIK